MIELGPEINSKNQWSVINQKNFSAPRTCAIWGDPHYQTFDMEQLGMRYDFMGHCTYTAVTTNGCPKPTKSISPLPHFLQIDVSNSVHNQKVDKYENIRFLPSLLIFFQFRLSTFTNRNLREKRVHPIIRQAKSSSHVVPVTQIRKWTPIFPQR